MEYLKERNFLLLLRRMIRPHQLYLLDTASGLKRRNRLGHSDLLREEQQQERTIDYSLWKGMIQKAPQERRGLQKEQFSRSVSVCAASSPTVFRRVLVEYDQAYLYLIGRR